MASSIIRIKHTIILEYSARPVSQYFEYCLNNTTGLFKPVYKIKVKDSIFTSRNCFVIKYFCYVAANGQAYSKI